jgi:hypothetical protein
MNNKKLFLSLLTVLFLGILGGCSKGPDDALVISTVNDFWRKAHPTTVDKVEVLETFKDGDLFIARCKVYITQNGKTLRGASETKKGTVNLDLAFNKYGSQWQYRVRNETTVNWQR